MPAARASCGELNFTSRPSQIIVPRSGGKTPLTNLMSVDLPAPFSPTRPNTSPGRISSWSGFKAVTPANDLLSEFNLSNGVGTAGGIITLVFAMRWHDVSDEACGRRWKLFPKASDCTLAALAKINVLELRFFVKMKDGVKRRRSPL